MPTDTIKTMPSGAVLHRAAQKYKSELKIVCLLPVINCYQNMLQKQSKDTI